VSRIEKFKFKFDKLLNYRCIIEDNAKAEYNDFKIRLDKEKQQLDKYLNYYNNLNIEKNTSLENGSILYAKMYTEYINAYKQKIKNQRDIVLKVEEDTEISKNKLINASKDRKTYDKLKEKYIIDYENSLKRNEDKLLDQIISYSSNNIIGG